MAWNEPGNNRGQDPWGDRGNDNGPPDLEQVFQNLKDKFGGMFGGSSGSSGSNFGFILLLLIFLVGWALVDAVYIIQPAERGVVTRFGAYVTTLEAGLAIRWPRPIEQVDVINTEQIRSINHTATTLTEDENIVDIELTVQYNISDVMEYSFNVLDPDLSLEQATESAVRTIIGENKMEYVLTEGRSQIGGLIESQLQEILSNYKTGLKITSVNMQPIKAPEEVKGAFDDVIKAREDRERQINEAEAYTNDLLPKAQGAAARILAEASAYKSRVIAEAEGESSRFDQLLTQYSKAPEVTRQRLYLDAIQSMLSHSSKVLVDSKSGNNMIYLPIDKLMEGKKVGKQGEKRDIKSYQDLPPVEPEQPVKAEPEASTETRSRGTR